MANIWGRKPIAVLQAEAKEGEFGSVPGEPRLRRTLSLASLIALGIGCIIGAGIFVLTGNAAAHAGPAVSLSFILAGLVSTFAGLCYAEMASTVPVAGSAYTYAYATMGEFVAWVIGWDLILEYAFGATTVAIGWSGYLTSLLRDLGLVIPAKFASAPLAYDPTVGTWSPTDALVNLPAMFIIVLITILLVVGIRELAKVNNAIVTIKLVIIVVFILAGVWFIKTSNWVTPSNPSGAFIPPNLGPGQYGWSGIIRGAGVVFFAYIGFDAVSTAAQEARNPQKDMPLAILGSLAICTLLYVLVSVVITGIVPFDRLNVPDPIVVGRCHRIWLARRHHQARRGSWPEFGDFGVLARPAADLLFDGARRPAASVRGDRSSKASHPLCHDADHRRDRRDPRWSFADRSRRRTGEHRHLVRIRRGLPRRSRFTDHPSGDPPPVQDAGRVCRGAARRGFGGFFNGRPAGRYLAAPCRLAGDRPCHLFLVRPQPQSFGAAPRRRRHALTVVWLGGRRVRVRVTGGATGAFSASLRVRKMRKTVRMLIPSCELSIGCPSGPDRGS